MRSELPDGWTATTLGDVLTLKRGYDLPSRDRRPGEVPIVSSSGVTDFHKTAKVEGPGVVTGRYGTIGKVFYLDQDFWPLNTALYVRDFKGNDPRYCADLLRTINFHAYDGKSGVPGINRNDLHALEVVVPAPREQARIAWILGTLDDKIDSNRRLAELLEETSAAQFRAGCVEFVGVDHFQETEIGRIPTGWSVKPLAVIAEQRRDRASTDAGLPFIGLNAMPRGSTVLGSWLADGPTGQTWRFDTGDILFGKLRPYFRKVGVAPIAGRCSTEIVVLKPRNDVGFGLLLGHVASRRFIDHCVAVSTGTRMPRAEWKVAGEYRVAVPPDDQLAELDQLIRALYSQIRSLIHEWRTLTAIRDALLPKLISGQLRVPDAADPEEVIGPVVEEAAS